MNNFIWRCPELGMHITNIIWGVFSLNNNSHTKAMQIQKGGQMTNGIKCFTKDSPKSRTFFFIPRIKIIEIAYKCSNCVFMHFLCNVCYKIDFFSRKSTLMLHRRLHKYIVVSQTLSPSSNGAQHNYSNMQNKKSTIILCYDILLSAYCGDLVDVIWRIYYTGVHGIKASP